MKNTFRLISVLMVITLLFSSCGKATGDVDEDAIDEDTVSQLDSANATDSALSIDDETVSDLSTDGATVIKMSSNMK